MGRITQEVGSVRREERLERLCHRVRRPMLHRTQRFSDLSEVWPWPQLPSRTWRWLGYERVPDAEGDEVEEVEVEEVEADEVEEVEVDTSGLLEGPSASCDWRWHQVPRITQEVCSIRREERLERLCHRVRERMLHRTQRFADLSEVWPWPQLPWRTWWWLGYGRIPAQVIVGIAPVDQYSLGFALKSTLLLLLLLSHSLSLQLCWLRVLKMSLSGRRTLHTLHTPRRRCRVMRLHVREPFCAGAPARDRLATS